jgi:hypothetical protein
MAQQKWGPGVPEYEQAYGDGPGTPAARHDEHTLEEWTANPASAPIWARSGDKIICGGTNWIGCAPCERYAHEEWPERERRWKVRMDNAEAKFIAKNAKKETRDKDEELKIDADAVKKAQEIISQFQGGATSS